MARTDIALFIVSHNEELFNALGGVAELDNYFGSVFKTPSLSSIEGSLRLYKSSVILLEVESQASFVINFLSSLIEKYNLLVIITGDSLSAASAFLKGRIRDFVQKPRHLNHSFSLVPFVNNIISKSTAFFEKSRAISFNQMVKSVDTSQRIIAIGASTGGPEALEKIFKRLPAEVPPILVVQHMPSGFTKFFADRLNNLCSIEVREAATNDLLRKGLALIAPADYHMALIKKENRLAVDCYKGEKIHGVMPAADVLFESVANIMRGNSVGVILTGMGSDGAKGLKLMHNQGAKTIGQDMDSSIVYGMPKVAYNLGAVDYQLDIDKIAGKILELS